MTILVIRFLNILLSGLIAGVFFGIWMGYNPQSLSFHTYIEQQQSVINALNVLMPVLGQITTIVTVVAAYMQKEKRKAFTVLLIASALLMISGLVTRFGNQPINSMVMTWSPLDVPTDWIELRDKWWSLHIIRTVSAIAAFCLIVWANMRRV